MGPYRLPEKDDDDFNRWSRAMKRFLRGGRLRGVVDGSLLCPSDTGQGKNWSMCSDSCCCPIGMKIVDFFNLRTFPRMKSSRHGVRSIQSSQEGDRFSRRQSPTKTADKLPNLHSLQCPKCWNRTISLTLGSSKMSVNPLVKQKMLRRSLLLSLCASPS